MFIAFEGIDAAGKHTQSENLKEHLKKSPGVNVVKFDLPKYDSITGEMIKDYLQGKWRCDHDSVAPPGEKFAVPDVQPTYMSDPSTYLFQCCQLVNRLEVLPDALWEPGPFDIFIADRYNASAYAYGKAFGIDFEWLIRTHKRLPQPDLNIFLDISVEESFKRRPDRRDQYEKNSKMLETVRQSYLDIFEMLGPTYAVIDASGTEQETFERVLTAIRGRIDVMIPEEEINKSDI